MLVFPGLRKLISSKIQQLFNTASFDAPLTHSAIPTRAATGTTATFTRATTKTWQNNDGYLVTGLAGEIGFPGARRVRNWIQAPTENWSSAGWVKSGISVSGNRLTATGANGIIYDNAALAMGIGRTAVGSVTLSRVTGTGNIDVSTNGGTTWTTVSVTGARVSVSLTGNINGQFAIRIVTSGDAVEATYPQLEDVTAQTTQTAGEYVSVGIASAPYYHGSFVDGVKCFSTDINGAPIPSTTLLGYLAEGARTNLCLQSNAFTTTWIDGGAAATQGAVGPDGGTTAWTLTDDSAVATESRYRPITLTAATHTFSVRVKKTTGAQSSYPILYVDDSAVASRAALCTIDTTNGVATVWSALTGWSITTSSAACKSFNDDYWEVSLTYLATAADWRHFLIPAGTANATQSTGTFDATVTGSAVFYGAQTELGSFASSYIPTTTIAVARNADVLTYSSAGNIDGTKGWAYVEMTSSADFARLVSMADYAGGEPMMVEEGPGVRLYDGTAFRSGLTYTNSATVVQKIATGWSGSESRVAKDGTVSAALGFDGDLGAGTRISLGGTVSSNQYLYGTIRNIRIGQRQLSASELQAITR